MSTKKTIFSTQYLRILSSTALLVLLLGFNANAQRDLIVTQAGEEIRCRILDESAIRFSYAFIQNGKAMRSEIFKSNVVSFKYNHFEEDLPNAKLLPKVNGPEPKPEVVPSRRAVSKNKEKKKEASLEKKTQTNEPKEPLPVVAKADTAVRKFKLGAAGQARIGLRGGIGNLLQDKQTPQSALDYYNEKLQRGWLIGADAAYFFSPKVGAGISYTKFMSQNSAANISYPNRYTGNVATGSLSNKHRIHFIAPQFLLRHKLDSRSSVVLSLMPGLLLFRDHAVIEGKAYTIKGQGFGTGATLGVDFQLGNEINGRDVVVAIAAGYQGGALSSLNYGGQLGVKTLDTPLNLQRLDFTIGLYFSRFPKYFRLTSY